MRRDAPEAPLITAAELIVRTSESTQLWPGWVPQQFLLFQQDGGALLVLPAGQAAPTPFEPLAEAPARLRGRAFIAASAPAGISVSPSYRVGTFTLSAIELKETPQETAELLFHEAFHTYQAQAFADASAAGGLTWGEEPAPDRAALADPVFVAHTQLAGQLLAAAVTADSATLPDRVRDYLAVREVAFAGVPPDVRQVAVNIERKEGTAVWVGAAGARAAGAAAPYGYTQMLDFLNNPPSSGAPETRFRNAAYYAGSGQAFVLDRLRSGWARPVEAGADLESLLRAAVSFASESAVARADAVKARHGFEDYVARAEESQWSPLADPPEQQFHQAGAITVAVEFPLATGEFPSFSATETEQPLTAHEGAVLVGLQALRFSMAYQGLTITTGAVPYMMDFRLYPTTGRVAFRLPALPTITGRTGDAACVRWPEGGQITGSSATISTARPAVVQVSGDIVTLRIGAQPPGC